MSVGQLTNALVTAARVVMMVASGLGVNRADLLGAARPVPSNPDEAVPAGAGGTAVGDPQITSEETTVLTHELLPAQGILVLTPGAPLEGTDFEALAREVDPYLEQNGKLHGLLVDAAAFPGWKDFAGLVAHLRFVRDHHRKIEKIAVASDSNFLSVAPAIVSHFVRAEVKHFPHAQRDEAMRWLTEGGN